MSARRMSTTACDDGNACGPEYARAEGERVAASEIVVVRHGATEWSVNGRHTGRTDLPLTEDGRKEAEGLRDRLGHWDFALVLTSPMQRARETARLAGLGEEAQVDDDLTEYDYGEYEGRTTADVRTERPGWSVWDGCPNGETPDTVGARVDRVIARAAAAGGPVLLFGHGHSLRILVARWVGLPAVGGRLLTLATGTISVLGYEREQRVIERLNA